MTIARSMVRGIARPMARALKGDRLGPVSATWDFAGNTYSGGTLADATNYVRSNTGWFENLAGEIAPFAADVVRRTDKGVAVEAQRTNLALRSEAMDNAYWTKLNVTVSADGEVAPDGATTMDRLVEAATTSYHLVLRTFTITQNAPYTFSLFARQDGTRRYLRLIFDNGTAPGIYATFDLLTGTVSGEARARSGGTPLGASIEAYADGVYRCSVSGVAGNVNTGGRIAALLTPFADDTNYEIFTSYQGNTNNGIYVWGAQFEAGADITSYIPTAAATVTRSADALELVLPVGTHDLTFTFADNSTQRVNDQTGDYVVPTNLRRRVIAGVVATEAV